MANYRKLIKRLAELYPTIEKAKLILKYANIPTGQISFSSASEVNWSNIIEVVEPRGKLQEVIQIVIDETNDDELLQYIQEETDVVPLQDAQKAFHTEIHVDEDELKKLVANGRLEDVLAKLNLIADQLTTEYKNSIVLLTANLNSLNREYHEGLVRREDYRFDRNRIANSINYQIDEIQKDLEIKNILDNLDPPKEEFKAITGINVPQKEEYEKVMRGHDSIVPIEWLSQALETAKMVCKIEFKNGTSGTGFLVKGGYVLTNHHVICKHFPMITRCELDCQASLDCPHRARVLFNYKASSNGAEIAYELDPEDTYIVNKELDYALIKIKDDPNQPLSQWGYAEFAFKSPAKDDLVNIIQHPEGHQKKIAMPDTVLSIWSEKNYLFYMADTKKGSSGSPVYDQDWRVVALHHAGKDKKQGGLVINAAGEKHEANRGILISAILADLKAKDVDIS